MALFGDVKNTIDCSITVLGTGQKNCPFRIDLINGIYALERGLLIADADTFDKAYLQELVQQGEAIPLINATEFIDNSAEDTIETTQSGVDITANKGRYNFTIMYKKGEYFNKALSSLESFGLYDIMLVDEEGSFLMTENRSGVAKGFKAGRFQPDKRKFADGTTATSKSVTFQLLDRTEFDSRLVWLTADDAGFSPDEVDGINDITATFNVAPTNLDTDLVIDLVSTADNNTALEGLVTADLLVTVDTVVTATTWVESSTIAGRYTGTLAALATDEDVEVQIWDATTTPQANVAVKGDDLYRSNVLAATVIA